MRWYSTFLGLRDSDGLLNQQFCNAWIFSPFLGSADDDFAMFVAGGEPYPHP